MDTDQRYSIVEYPGGTGQVAFEFSFQGGYISPDHISVTSVDTAGAETDLSYTLTGPSTITLAAPVVAGLTIRIRRLTPKDTPLVNYKDGAMVSESNMDLANQQAILSSAEAMDEAFIRVGGLNARINAIAENDSALFIDDSISDADPQASFMTRSAVKIGALINTALASAADAANAAIATALAGAASVANNLSDLADKAAARLNLGLNHLPVNAGWYGLVEGDDASQGAANTTAFQTLFADLAVSKRFHVKMPAGTYWFADNGTGAGIDINVGNIILEGAAAGGTDETSSVLKFPAGVAGIRIQNDLSSGTTGKDAVSHSTAGGTVLRNLSLDGSFTTTETEAHGVQLRRRATLENLTIKNFGGDGLYISADGAAASGASPPFGNDNAVHISRPTIFNCRNGIKFDGQDANGGVVLMPNINACRQWGVWDNSGFGNTVLGGQIGTNGIHPTNDGVTVAATQVSYGGNQYSVIVGQEAWCSINAPTGTTADNQGWYYMRAGAPTTGIPAWFSGMAVRAGGVARSKPLGVNAANFVGVYSEGDQGKGQIFSPAFVSGGLLAGWCYQNKSSPGATPLIRGAQDVTSTGPAVHVEPVLKVVSGAVTSSLGATNGNVSNIGLNINHSTLSPNGTQLQFSQAWSAGGDMLFTNFGTNVFWVSLVNTALQFGTGAAVKGAFVPERLMITDAGGTNIVNARHLMIDTAAPATGAHGQGEWQLDRSTDVTRIGNKCTVAGTPGTWSPLYGMTAAKQAAFAAWTGTGSKATKAVGTATVGDCAAAIKSLIDDLQARGILA